MVHAYDGSLEQKQDERIIAHLRGNGIDLSVPYALSHFFYFEEDQKETAFQVQRACILAGYEVELHESKRRRWLFFSRPIWIVKARTTSVISEDSIRAESIIMLDIAAAAQVRYDGWDVAIPAPGRAR